MAKGLKIKQDWDLSLLFESLNSPAIEKNLKLVKKGSYRFIKKWKDREDYLKKPRVLKEALDEYEEWTSKFGTDGDAGYFYYLSHALDQNDPKLKAKLNQITDFANKIQNDIQFFEMRISKIDPKKQSDFIEYKPLSPYRHFLERLFEQARHLLSEPEEKIMNLKSSTSYTNWIRMVSGLYTKEEREVLTEEKTRANKSFSDILSLISSKNKRVRDDAAKAFNDILQTHIEVAENEINSVLQYKKINDELRGFDRPDQARHLSDDIDTGVVDILVKAVSDNFKIAKDFYKLKAKLFEVDKLEYHERNVEYGQLNKKYEYKDAVDLTYGVFNDLDSDFGSIFKDFVENGKIDVYPKKGKTSGAFAIFHLKTQPVYVLLNYTKLLNDIRTLAHEFGHAINDELIRKAQNSLNFGTPTSTAEVASTFMEDFVLQELMREADDEYRLTLMVSKLDQDISTIFRQIAFYNFETDLHSEFRKTGYVSKEEIGKLFQKHMKAYMGPAVKQSEGSENWWAYVSHFRRFFYVYSYASGLLISKSLQASVKNDPEFIYKVKKFLSAGLSDSPKNIFMEMGVDINNNKFWEKGIGEVVELLEETRKLANKMKKIRP